MRSREIAVFVVLTSCATVSGGGGGSVTGWLTWRGPQQDGTSLETGLPNTVAVKGANYLWEYDLSGRGTPVIANDRVYALGYQGEGPDLQEVLVCLDAGTGKKIWERRFNDFLSDAIYSRYSIGSPAVDSETGNVYALTTPGIFSCYTRDGKLVWQYSMMEAFGRMTFPNGRTGGPIVDDDLVIMRGITSNWGAQGVPQDRFYAFGKKSGKLVWASSPGERPKDNSFALPFFSWQNGKRVFYSGEGSGNVVCVNARTGEPQWRYTIGAGGINASVVLHKDKIIAIQDCENIDSSESGRMVAIKTGAEPKPGQPVPVVLDKTAEVWRNSTAAFSSSLVLVGDRVYLTNRTGELHCVNADSGQALWKHKLAPDQLHASPLYADGKLYVPMQDGSFHILRPSDRGAQVLCTVQLAGNCLGAPAVCDGRIYVHTTEKLYCFGSKKTEDRKQKTETQQPKVGPAVAIQIIPSEVLLRPGEKAQFTARGIDAKGFATGPVDVKQLKWAKYIPPTALVRAEMNGEFNADGELVAAKTELPSAGAYEATLGNLKGYIRGRVLPDLPLKENFEGFQIAVAHATEAGVKFAYPPLSWIGARFRWEIRELDGNKVFAKTLDNVLLQRAFTFIGHPDMKNYTVEADVMSDGNRRIMSSVGVINQRYTVALLGNAQELEVSSNYERVKVSAKFAWSPKTWYRLKTRVDVAADGSGVVRAKAWKRGDPEPATWTIEVPHKNAHANGSPGIYGFAPQSQFRIYVDNILVTRNE